MLAETAPAVFAPSTTTELPCTHCGLPVVCEAGEQPATIFCCAGCASVYSILNEAGLSDFYRQRAASGASPLGPASAGTSRTYADFDQPEFARLYCKELPLGRRGTEFFLENVHCAACVWLVEKITTVLAGVTEARLDVSRGALRVGWDPSVIGLSQIASWLDSIGYPCHPMHGVDREAVRRREERALLMRLGVAGAAAGNAMLLAIAMYSGAFSGMDADYTTLFRWGSVLVALPSVLWCAGVFYRGALSALRTRTPHMDLPVSVGIIFGSVDGIVSTLRAHGEIYFDTITMLVFLLLVGRYLQQRAQRRADRTSEQLSSLGPSTARLLDGAAVREVPAETVPIGAVVEVRTGEHVPIDGVVLEGTSSIDSSFLTGESMPGSVGPGDLVHAGTVNLSSRLVVRAQKTGHETRLARLADSVSEAAQRRAPIVIAANRLSGYFVVTILVAAALTIAVTWHVSASAAIERAVALLVVTCPCALALATPLTVSAALGKAARGGLMIKGGESLEALARPGLVVFDKTGTLTRGKLTVMGFAGDEGARVLVAAAEAGSAHPIAVALCTAFSLPAQAPAESMRETLGGGVEAAVSGRTVVVGSADFVRARSAQEEAWVEESVNAFARRALTPVLAAADGRILAVVGVGDPVRDEARESLEALRRLGHRLAVLSGDQPDVVRAVVARIGVPFDEVIGGASPERKLAFIEERAKSGPVFMVGDGINDAAALSAATVGIAVHGGAEASLAAADIFATTNGLAPLVELFEGAGRTLRVIRGNLRRSLVYNLTVGGLAATGFVGPLLAAILMPVSSIGVITSSYRSRTFGSKP